MRGMVAVLIVMVLGARAGADDSIEHTRAVVAKHAKRVHTTRMIIGSVGVVLGAGATAGGAYIIDNTREGGFVDLSAIEYAFGYSFVGVGGSLFAIGSLALLGSSPVEDLHAELNRTVLRDGAELDALMTKYEQRDARRRRVLRGVGLGLAVAGLTSIAVVAYGSPTLGTPLGRGLATTGGAATYLGATLVLGSLSASAFEKLRDDDARMLAPVVAPAHGGGTIGFAGTF